MDVNNLRHPSAFLKVVEIVILIIIMALYFSQFSVAWMNYATSVFVGCFLNALVLLVLRLLGYNQIQNTPLELIFYSYYLLGTFISSILLFTESPQGPWIAAGVFGLLLVFVFAAELYVSYSGLTGTPISFPPETFPSVPPQAGHQQQPPPQNFPTEAYPPPPTYLNSQMQNVDLGNPFEESHLQQL